MSSNMNSQKTKEDQAPKLMARDPRGPASTDITRSAGVTARLWFGLRDPRIVRVPRSSGGKDRHSKVRTLRGLRDRRVRLSVPTATFIYDLQDKLGLSQPSKVVEWLMNAARPEIDRLPPLPVPFGSSTSSNVIGHNSPTSHHQIQQHATNSYGNCFSINVPHGSIGSEAYGTTLAMLQHQQFEGNYYDASGCGFSLDAISGGADNHNNVYRRSQ